MRQAASTVGNDSVTVIKLNADYVSRLADEAGVSESAIRETAPKLDDQSLWSSSIDNLEHIYTNTPGEVRSNLVDLACDGVRGEITSEDELNQNIAYRFTGYTPDQLQALANSVFWTCGRTFTTPEPAAAPTSSLPLFSPASRSNSSSAEIRGVCPVA